MGESQILPSPMIGSIVFFWKGLWFRTLVGSLWWDRSGGIAHCSDPWIDGELSSFQPMGISYIPSIFLGSAVMKTTSFFDAARSGKSGSKSKLEFAIALQLKTRFGHFLSHEWHHFYHGFCHSFPSKPGMMKHQFPSKAVDSPSKIRPISWPCASIRANISSRRCLGLKSRGGGRSPLGFSWWHPYSCFPCGDWPLVAAGGNPPAIHFKNPRAMSVWE